MKSRMLMVLAAALFAVSMPAAVLAEGPEYGQIDAFQSAISSSSAGVVDSDMWPVSGPLETGAVPMSGASDRISPESTHFNPFHPELRSIDLGGGGD